MSAECAFALQHRRIRATARAGLASEKAQRLMQCSSIDRQTAQLDDTLRQGAREHALELLDDLGVTCREQRAYLREVAFAQYIAAVCAILRVN